MIFCSCSKELSGGRRQAPEHPLASSRGRSSGGWSVLFPRSRAGDETPNESPRCVSAGTAQYRSRGNCSSFKYCSNGDCSLFKYCANAYCSMFKCCSNVKILSENVKLLSNVKIFSNCQNIVKKVTALSKCILLTPQGLV